MVSSAALAGAALGLAAGFLNYRVLTLMMDLRVRALRDEEPEPGADKVLERMTRLKPRLFAALMVSFPVVGFLTGAALGEG